MRRPKGRNGQKSRPGLCEHLPPRSRKQEYSPHEAPQRIRVEHNKKKTSTFTGYPKELTIFLTL